MRPKIRIGILMENEETTSGMRMTIEAATAALKSLSNFKKKTRAITVFDSQSSLRKKQHSFLW